MTDITDITDTTRNKLIGQGSYGCVYKPGINCSGNINTNKKMVSKITILESTTINEFKISNLVKQINNYSNRFCPIIKKCNVSFNKILNTLNESAEECEMLNKLYETQYVVLYLNYIPGRLSLKEFLYNSFKTNNSSIFYPEMFNSLMYSLTSVLLLNSRNIVHNDLHSNNIIFNTRTNKPIIIDFGLSYFSNDFYKINKENLNLITISKYFFYSYISDFKTFIFLPEKMFFSFIVKNNYSYYDNIQQFKSNSQKNVLTKTIVDKFIIDCTSNPYITAVFNTIQLEYYKNNLILFYYKYLNKDVYPLLKDVLLDILNYLFKFTDFYSIVIIYIRFLNNNNKNNKNNKNNLNDAFNYLIKNFLLLILEPNPDLRLSNRNFILTIMFIIDYIKKINLQNYNHTSSVSIFLEEFNSFLNKNKINPNIFFNKNFVFIDFNYLLEAKNIKYIKSLNINLKNTII